MAINQFQDPINSDQYLKQQKKTERTLGYSTAGDAAAVLDPLPRSSSTEILACDRSTPEVSRAWDSFFSSLLNTRIQKILG